MAEEASAAAIGSHTTSDNPERLSAVASAGQAAYQNNCVRCHGATGAGDGRDAKRVFPRPRKLAEGVFKFRTTASGTPPTDGDLFRTISTGLPGSRMPEFTRLPEETRWQLVAYVKSLSPIFKDQKPEILNLGKDPGPAKMNHNKGKELFTSLGCVACHGNLGRGDGPSAATLVDNWGNPIRAADLTQGWNYRAGSTPKDIQARLMAGIDGAPMPSYIDAVSQEDSWQLAYYVRSLQEKPNFRQVIEAVKISGRTPPMDPADLEWQKAPRTDLHLSGNFYRQGEILPTTVSSISIQAMYNEEAVLWRLTWNDPSQSHDRGQPGRAVGSGAASDSQSHENPPDALEILTLPEKRLQWEMGSVRSWPASHDAPAPAVLSWSANPTQATQTLESKASYSDGQWTLLFRQLRQKETPALIGIAVWDGGNSEEGRHRANSNWVEFKEVLK